MKKKNTLRQSISIVVTVALIFVAVISYGSRSVADEISSKKCELIENLISERGTLINEILFENKKHDEQKRDDLDRIDNNLIELGAEFLSWDEVCTRFGIESEGEKAPIPGSSVNTWISSRYTYTDNGVSYDIQKLVAQPSSSSSPLYDNGTKVVTFSQNWQAGAENVIKSLATASVGQIPAANIAVTVYDVISSFLSGINATTQVDVPNIAYTWSNTTTASFMYVRRSTQTDEDQELSMVCTRTHSVVGYQSPSFYYQNSGGAWVIAPQIIQGQRAIYAVPNGHDYLQYAVQSFLAGGTSYRCVSRIQISGPETKVIQNIYPCYPSFPAHCE